MFKLSQTPSQMGRNPKEHEAFDRIKIEDRQHQKMHVLGHLMFGMVHDFNNILTTILSFTELAKHSKPHSCVPHLQGVTNAANRGRDLVQQILLFGSQREQDPKPINMASVMKEVLSFIRVSLPSNIVIDSGQPARLCFVMADPIQISQVLMNLCLNGAHAIGTTGGVLEISLLEVTMNRESMKRYPNLTPGPFVRLRVRDTGSGIPPFVMERIFDPFFTTKKSGEGTGMGLAVVKDIVTRHHGMISVDSVLGQGTIFDIYLPQIPESLKEQDGAKVPVSKGSECILFIDNERSICELVQKNLTNLGYAVITKTSSSEALNLFANTPDQFDLVITDCSMPQISGESLTQELLRIRPDIPIILCTGHSQAVADEQVKAIGVQGSLLKPFTESDVANGVRQVLDLAHEERPLRVWSSPDCVRSSQGEMSLPSLASLL